MKWNEKCILELTHHNLFESTEHRSRFVDLLSCYWESPFFSKGLCKCMYLAAWTDDTFNEFLEGLKNLDENLYETFMEWKKNKEE